MKQNDACRIEPHPGARTLEFIAYHWPATQGLDADWPVAPGAVRAGAGREPELLHFAPGRWLAPDPSPALAAMLESAERAGAGTLVEVTGKWDRLDVYGSDARRVLACAVGIEAVLGERSCAAVTLFDCPAIISGRGTEYVLWVQSSYSADFTATAARLRSALTPES